MAPAGDDPRSSSLPVGEPEALAVGAGDVLRDRRGRPRAEDATPRSAGPGRRSVSGCNPHDRRRGPTELRSAPGVEEPHRDRVVPAKVDAVTVPSTSVNQQVAGRGRRRARAPTPEASTSEMTELASCRAPGRRRCGTIRCRRAHRRMRPYVVHGPAGATRHTRGVPGRWRTAVDEPDGCRPVAAGRRMMVGGSRDVDTPGSCGGRRSANDAVRPRRVGPSRRSRSVASRAPARPRCVPYGSRRGGRTHRGDRLVGPRCVRGRDRSRASAAMGRAAAVRRGAGRARAIAPAMLP